MNFLLDVLKVLALCYMAGFFALGLFAIFHALYCLVQICRPSTSEHNRRVYEMMASAGFIIALAWPAVYLYVIWKRDEFND